MKSQIVLLLLFTLGVYSRNCRINEKVNKRGPHRCWHSDECGGDRYCSRFGYCHGPSNC